MDGYPHPWVSEWMGIRISCKTFLAPRNTSLCQQVNKSLCGNVTWRRPCVPPKSNCFLKLSHQVKFPLCGNCIGLSLRPEKAIAALTQFEGVQSFSIIIPIPPPHLPPALSSSSSSSSDLPHLVKPECAFQTSFPLILISLVFQTNMVHAKPFFSKN